MEFLINLFGREPLLTFIVLTGCVIRAARGERVPALQGFKTAFVPFFVSMMLLYLIEGAVGVLGMTIPDKPMIGLGGLFAFLSNFWIAGLEADGKKVEENGASGSILAIIKSILTFKKTA